MDYEGPLRIPKNEKLSADETEVEARFAAQIQGRLDEVIAEYLARFGTVIDTDRARELCADYSATKATRTRFSRAVYNPAIALVMRFTGAKSANPRLLMAGAFYSREVASARAKARPWRGWKKRPGLMTDMTFSWTARCRTTRQRGQRTARARAGPQRYGRSRPSRIFGNGADGGETRDRNGARCYAG